MNGFMPITKQELTHRGKYYADFTLVTGDSYVDHPSFGAAVIGRYLESLNFTVGIVAQPKTDEDYLEFGEPRYGFMVTSGNMDSMVNHYTVAKRKRSEDFYTAGGKAGARPDYALTVYSKAIRRLCPDKPIILGGLEASFRRFAHYDYWSDRVKHSVLFDGQGDILVYGMGELQIGEIALALKSGKAISEITDVLGTAYLTSSLFLPENSVTCPSFGKVNTDKEAFSRSYKMQIEEQDHIYGRHIVQQQSEGKFLVQNPPMRPLTTEEFDRVIELPYMRAYHPSYEAVGGVPAIKEVEFSITQNRGCFGDCNFCSITFHQGRAVTSRSKESIIREAKLMIASPNFKGYIHDVGGPTANFRSPSCAKQLEDGVCKHRKCLAPTPCNNLEVDHSEYLDILRALRVLPGVKKVFVRSGIRYDYLNLDPDKSFITELIQHHVSGQLRMAPEHSSSSVLKVMGKPSIQAFDKFKSDFYSITQTLGKEQFIVPYLMSSHPGATLEDAIDLAIYLKKNKLRPEQVQDFYPTPGTASTSMFYTGINPEDGELVYVAKSKEEKAMQRALLQYYVPANQDLVREALTLAGRANLIGSTAGCLVPAISSGNRYKKGYTKPKNWLAKDNKGKSNKGRK